VDRPVIALDLTYPVATAPGTDPRSLTHPLTQVLLTPTRNPSFAIR
jgi:hypothetical protein